MELAAKGGAAIILVAHTGKGRGSRIVKTIEIESGDKTVSIDIWPDGDIEITIDQEHYGWNDGGKAIRGEIILNKYQATEMLDFLTANLRRPGKDV